MFSDVLGGIKKDLWHEMGHPDLLNKKRNIFHFANNGVVLHIKQNFPVTMT